MRSPSLMAAVGTLSWALLVQVGAASPMTAPLVAALLCAAVLDDGAPF
jgi:hypothetical protein